MNKTTVVIPTAGLGSRVGDLSKNLNKSLLPFRAMPVIAHIIERFPKNTRFIVPIGYKADQVKDFLNIAYSDRHIEFVEIDDYTSSKSGPGYTISKCLSNIKEPFWYIPCDTYFTENIADKFYDEDTIFVKQVPSELSSLYTMFEVMDDRITKMSFKEHQDSAWLAFTGVMHINDWIGFSERLTTYHSPEIIWTIQQNSKVVKLNSWTDFGNIDIYKAAVSASQKYDWTKTDELTFICNHKVIKWWIDANIPKKKYDKTLNNYKVIPTNCMFKGEWLAYDLFEGSTLYDNHSAKILTDLLNWLDKEVWLQSNADLSLAAHEFYKQKTLKRIALFLKKYPNIEDASSIDGIEVKHWKYYLENINWPLLENTNLPGFIHGDLQFDNVIVNDLGEFKIIDWRHEFANLVDIGDIYYDLAKLIGGFIIDYSKIKQNQFSYTKDKGNIKLNIPHVKNHKDYISIVKKFIEDKGWDYSKVQLLIPLIFWNMAPLHTPPFDQFLWYLGILLFEEII
jgi:NDP-sugar pyrophosphorylase family protein